MTKRLLIIFLLGAFLLLGALALATIPLSGRVLRLSREFFVQQRELRAATANRAVAEAFDVFSKEFRQDLAKSAAMLADSETPIEFVRFLEQSATQANVSLALNLGSARKQKSDQWFSLDVQASGQGEYQGVFAFLRQLEHAPFAMEIQNISLNKIGSSALSGETANKDIKFSLGIKVYVKPSQARQ